MFCPSQTSRFSIYIYLFYYIYYILLYIYLRILLCFTNKLFSVIAGIVRKTRPQWPSTTTVWLQSECCNPLLPWWSVYILNITKLCGSAVNCVCSCVLKVHLATVIFILCLLYPPITKQLALLLPIAGLFFLIHQSQTSCHYFSQSLSCFHCVITEMPRSWCV